MPNKPNTPCRHPGCAALVPYGTKYCEVHKPLHPEEVRSAGARGYGFAEAMMIQYNLKNKRRLSLRTLYGARTKDNDDAGMATC